jgi:hypothetical protein
MIEDVPTEPAILEVIIFPVADIEFKALKLFKIRLLRFAFVAFKFSVFVVVAFVVEEFRLEKFPLVPHKLLANKLVTFAERIFARLAMKVSPNRFVVFRLPIEPVAAKI